MRMRIAHGRAWRRSALSPRCRVSAQLDCSKAFERTEFDMRARCSTVQAHDDAITATLDAVCGAELDPEKRDRASAHVAVVCEVASRSTSSGGSR